LTLWTSPGEPGRVQMYATVRIRKHASASLFIVTS
jgi:hypothetical protein